MQINPAEEWQRLTEHYRAMFDGELEELASSLGDLTETAQQVLHNEMQSRGLKMPGDKSPAPGTSMPAAPPRFTSSIDPDQHANPSTNVLAEDREEATDREYTWKTPLCECDTADQGRQIREVLKRAGIESWVEEPGSRYSFGLSAPRVVVAADQLEHAIEIVNQPIPQEIIDESREEVPEYVPPTCPKCGAEDPALESAEPVNSWVCEACGEQWTESAADEDGKQEATGR